MNSIRNLAGAVAAAALLAACSSSPHGSHAAVSAPPASAASRSAAAGTGSSPGSGTSGSPVVTPATGPAAAGAALTMKQARAVYTRIVSPGSALANKLGSAASGTAPFSEFRTDALAYSSELRAEIGKFRAVRWPANVQPRINALITTVIPSDIGCLQAVAAAGSAAAAQTVSNNNKDCQVADNSPIPDSIQSLLANS